MKIIERTVQEIGTSHLITLPKAWTKALKVKKGTTIKLIQSENGSLIITPEYTQESQEKHASFQYSAQFQRQFYKEYFEGNETITILFQETLKGAQRQNIQTFLNRFMNVQIIQETQSKIVVKCFKIDDLTMEECLNRMHHLTVSMLNTDSISTKKEMRDTTTRFYYMLVMQVRRYLTEGKYTQEKQVSLIRAMDYRMVAEKMQRIAEISMAIKINNKILTEIIDSYQKAFSYYMNKEFEKALPLWTMCNQLKTKTNDSNQQQIIRAIKEISMLVR